MSEIDKLTKECVDYAFENVEERYGKDNTTTTIYLLRLAEEKGGSDLDRDAVYKEIKRRIAIENKALIFETALSMYETENLGVSNGDEEEKRMCSPRRACVADIKGRYGSDGSPIIFPIGTLFPKETTKEEFLVATRKIKHMFDVEFLSLMSQFGKHYYDLDLEYDDFSEYVIGMGQENHAE